jgi:cobalt-zinc-cadmium efflux system membrane fusion protein
MQQGAGTSLLPVRSPLDGVVVERHATQGELVNPATPLFVVTDLKRMWILLDVREEDAKRVSLGQKVLVQPNDDAEESELSGSVTWIASSADPQTRTIKVRVEIANPDGQLRAHTFGTGRIVLREEPRAMVVPNEAIHWEGCCHIVFVRDKNYQKEGAPKFYHVRKVRLGVRENDHTEILAGLLPGEVIASKNSFVLEAQLLKSGLGPGCGCAHGH